MAVRGKTALERCGVGHWSHDKVPKGETRLGWIAGDTHCYPCHSSKASKPCLKLLIGDHHKCPGCDASVPIKMLGYVPLYRTDGKPMIVVVQDYVFETLNKLHLHHHVEWGREKGSGEGVWVRSSGLNRPWVTSIVAKQRPADITEALCKIWRLPEVLGYARAWLVCDDNAVSPPPPPPPDKSILERVTEVENEGRAKLRAMIREQFVVKHDEPKDLADLLPDPSVNGRHRKK